MQPGVIACRGQAMDLESLRGAVTQRRLGRSQQPGHFPELHLAEILVHDRLGVAAQNTGRRFVA